MRVIQEKCLTVECVYVIGTTVRPAKTAELIEMLFGMLTQVG